MSASKGPTESNVRQSFGPSQSPLPEAGADPGDTADPIDDPSLEDEAFELRAAQAIAGDEASIRSLWNDHRRWVAAILLAHKPRWADVEDLLQEVALSFVRKVHELRDPRALKPWLRTVALNAAHAAARSGKVRTWATGRQSADATHDADQRAAPDDLPADESHERRHTASRLMDLASLLPDGYREPLLLKALQNMSYREIGRLMGLPETTVETRIARARKQLRELAAAHGVA